MTRILKRGQKTYFKEDVVTCLADETMQKIFTQSEYGNRTVWMEELQEEAKERFNMDFTDEDYKSFKTLIAKDEYLLSLDDNADEEVEQPIEPILKENIELEHTEETTVEKAPKYSLTSQDQENVKKISEQTIYVAVAYPILKEALTYKVPKVSEKEHKEELENDIQKNNGF